MAAVSLSWDTNMAAVTSCENTLQYLQFDEEACKKVFLHAMPLRFSLTTETRILARWRMANEASSLNSALLRTFSLIALFFSRKRKGINALDQIYVCPCFNFPNCDICMECRVVNSTSQIFRVLL